MRSVPVLLLAFLASTCLAGPARAAERMMIVLDASGSMLARIGKEQKMSIARKVLNDVVDKLPAGIEVGLMAYGHRQKDACDDIQTLVPFGKLDRAKLKGAVAKIAPKGKTPISDAVRAAAEQLSFTEEKATVILISDGRETCERDPCAVGAELEAAGVDFTAHVIGFDVAEAEDRRQLQCLASNTGGRFLTAANAQELVAALREVAVEAPSPPPPPPAPPKKVEPSITAPEAVTPGRKFALEWTGPGDSNDAIHISRKTDKPGTYVGHVWATTSPLEIEAPDRKGDYELRYHSNSKGVLFAVPLNLDWGAKLEAPEKAKPGEKLTVKWSGPGASNDKITIARVGDAEDTYVSMVWATGREVTIEVPHKPGEYELRYDSHGNGILAAQPLVLDLGASLEVTGKVAPGEKFQVTWTGPGLGNDSIQLATVESRVGTYEDHAWTNANPVTLDAPRKLGKYEVRYVSPDHGVLAKAAVDVGVDVKLEAPAKAAPGSRFEVRFEGSTGPDDRIQVALAGSPPNRYEDQAEARDSPAKLKAPRKKGKYEVRYVSPANGIVASQPLELDLATSLTAPEKAMIGAKLEIEWAGPGDEGDRIQIARANQKPGQYVSQIAASESPTELPLPEKKGAYELRYYSGSLEEILAKQPLEATAEASLDAPDKAAPGERITVGWEGPGLNSDRIEVARPTQRQGNRLASVNLEDNPATIELPNDPGEYELRYWNPANDTILARRPIMVSTD